MRIFRQGYESRNDSVRGLACGPRRLWPCHWPQPTTPLTAERRKRTSGHADQEQIQMIATAIGTPKPSAPKIAGTNSESRLASCRTPGDDMTLLLGAPRASARPQDEQSIAPSD